MLNGDCITVMPTLAASSVDACVCDPPYHLTQASRGGSARVPGTGPFGRHRVGEKGFMGKTWDGGGVAFRVDVWAEVLRVLRPGAYLLAFGGTRTYHRMACAIEDAGFEISDSLGYLNAGDDDENLRDVWLAAQRSGLLGWLYGSGFPKHKSKLKPAWEPIVMARKPSKSATLLNIDECRIEVSDADRDAARVPMGEWTRSGTTGATDRRSERRFEMADGGRWPANVLLDEQAAAMLDEQAGQKGGGFGVRGASSHTYGNGKGFTKATGETVGYGDTGGASRFFYCAKASRAEREAGLDGEATNDRTTPMAGRGQPGLKCRACGKWKVSGNPCVCDAPEFEPTTFVRPPTRNAHPTVKPIALMRWLVRLVTPPNGVVLDPFTGSGTTGIACVQEGRQFVGIEREEEYVSIARARIRHHTPAQLETPA